MRVLIVGLGSISKKHIDALLTLNDSTEIYALRSNFKSSKVNGVVNIYSLEEIDIDIVDFIIISNPTSAHFSIIQQLEKYNKTLFIEKPLFSVITDETERLVERFEEKKISTYVACNLRFLHALIELKKMLKNVQINEVNVYSGSYLPDWRPNLDFRTVYSANKEMGGGVHIDLIHELDYVYWLFGKPNRTQSYFSNNSTLGISAFDYANYLWTYQNFSTSIILNYYRRDPKRSIEVISQSETFYVDLLENKIWIDNAIIFQSEQRILDTYYYQMQYFINNVLFKKERFNSIVEAHTILKLCIQD